jgi:alpha-ribazole phosphatase
MEIYLIRHTAPYIGQDVCYGQSDIALAPSFKEEWQILRGKLPEHFDAIYSSPLKRCQFLAERLNGAAIQYDERLLELNFGDWEMKSWNEIDQGDLKVWMDHFVEQKTPGGESFRQLCLRTTAFLQDLEKNSFKTIALVTHAGVIRAIISHILGMPLQNAFQLKLDYGAVSLMTLRENLYRLAYLNK